MNKLEKAYKSLGLEYTQELEAMAPDSLKKRIVEANEAIRAAAEELELNEKYQELKAAKTALEAGKNEVNRRQNAIILLGLHFLKEKGQ